MIVYHGSDTVVECPDVVHSFRPLDFGKAFYVTTNLEQATRWAKRKSDISKSIKSYVSFYELDEDYSSFSVKSFSDDLEEWIDFVCGCRSGSDIYKEYDIIIGQVADDRVFRVVDLYQTGIWDKARAIKEIKVYPKYDQIAFVSQTAIDKLLVFKSSEEV